MRQVGADAEAAFAEYSLSVNAKIGEPGSDEGSIQASVDTVADAVATTNDGGGNLNRPM